MTGTALDPVSEFRAVLAKHADRLDLALIDRALAFSASAHRGQKRMSGDDFVSHSIAVATILVDQFLDSTSIAAALLHDVVEDSDLGVEDIAGEFGREVADLVDGLTKIAHLTFRSRAEEQVENYRKLVRGAQQLVRAVVTRLRSKANEVRHVVAYEKIEGIRADIIHAVLKEME